MASIPSILVVDDEPTIRLALVYALEAEGYQVSNAADGLEAVAKVNAEKGKFDLIIMDIRMPLMDGIAALKEIRDGGAEMPIILVSSHGTPDKVVDALRHRVSGFLSKPLKPTDIRYTAEHVLARNDGSIEPQCLFDRALNQVSKGQLRAANKTLRSGELDDREQLLNQALRKALAGEQEGEPSLPLDLFLRLSYGAQTE